MEGWGEEGEGRWITVYANSGHAYAVIAGYRWDTSGNGNGETGPRWHENLRDNVGFTSRHPAGTSRDARRSLLGGGTFGCSTQARAST
jgi:hypothetical protein